MKWVAGVWSSPASMDYTKNTVAQLITLCAERKICTTSKNKGDLVKLLKEKDRYNSMPTLSHPEFSKVPELKLIGLVDALTLFYDILEGRKQSISEPDPFAQGCVVNFFGLTEQEIAKKTKDAQQLRALTMAWGYFHQRIIGLLPDWETYANGHPTKCDNGSLGGTMVAEVKNNINTMNADSRKSVIEKLVKQHSLGKRAILVNINGDALKIECPEIESMSGRQFYEELSGRPDFMDDLLSTTNECFRRFKTLAELKAALGIA